ncbi:MAG: hypothetical protein IJ161_04015 [Bacteroidales bacterium]|nr:hypothetical protein [Bacteroidales bacterium]
MRIIQRKTRSILLAAMLLILPSTRAFSGNAILVGRFIEWTKGDVHDMPVVGADFNRKNKITLEADGQLYSTEQLKAGSFVFENLNAGKVRLTIDCGEPWLLFSEEFEIVDGVNAIQIEMHRDPALKDKYAPKSQPSVQADTADALQDLTAKGKKQKNKNNKNKAVTIVQAYYDMSVWDDDSSTAGPDGIIPLVGLYEENGLLVYDGMALSNFENDIYARVLRAIPGVEVGNKLVIDPSSVDVSYMDRAMLIRIEARINLR